LKIEPARAPDGQLLDPLQVLVNSKMLQDMVAKGVLEVVGVDSKGRQQYRKL
jgi:hypothetical protein